MGVAVVGESVVTDRFPQKVHVAGHVGGAHVAEQCGRRVGRVGLEGGIGGRPPVDLIRGFRPRQLGEPGLNLPHASRAPEQGAASDAARVEADGVEPDSLLVGVEVRAE